MCAKSLCFEFVLVLPAPEPAFWRVRGLESEDRLIKTFVFEAIISPGMSPDELWASSRRLRGMLPDISRVCALLSSLYLQKDLI